MKNKYYKLFILLISFVMVIAVFGCASEDEPEDEWNPGRSALISVLKYTFDLPVNTAKNFVETNGYESVESLMANESFLILHEENTQKVSADLSQYFSKIGILSYHDAYDENNLFCACLNNVEVVGFDNFGVGEYQEEEDGYDFIVSLILNTGEIVEIDGYVQIDYKGDLDGIDFDSEDLAVLFE